jgi:inorganic pyrophosphatase
MSHRTNFKAHPWHGISPGALAPHQVIAFIEIIPSDSVKYEIDKETGYLMVDRPQRYSNRCPALYGFIPQTFCGDNVGKLASSSDKDTPVEGDGDPLDICVLAEKHMLHGDILVRAIPIGGFRMIDRGEADDKIIAVLADDALYGEYRDLNACPKGILSSLEHYFLTYKQLPSEPKSVEISERYGVQSAHQVIQAAREDYARAYPL